MTICVGHEVTTTEQRNKPDIASLNGSCKLERNCWSFLHSRKISNEFTSFNRTYSVHYKLAKV